ncbi:hypothetical protein [Arthrobacter sp. CG_A4]|uniref:hypothetical protein n=1 Tax=Arthrobacter sp. CG_A4 TaxID=3071706 RepID=UPI002E126367
MKSSSFLCHRRSGCAVEPCAVGDFQVGVLELRRRLWDQGVFTADDGGAWRVEAGNLLICERGPRFVVAVAMGTEPVLLPAGTVLLSAAPLAEDGRLQPNNAAWVLRG